MQNLNKLLKVILQSNLDFVLIGGYASVVHGSSHLTRDLDICMAMTEENIQNLRGVLNPYNPRLRMNPNFKPSFMEEPKSLKDLNAIYFETDLGVLDILKEITAVGDYEEIKKEAVTVELFSKKCKVISLEQLIRAKEFMGRDKDKIVLKELYSIKGKFK